MRRLLLLVALLLVAPVHAESGLSDDERAWLDAHGPIRYAPDPAYPPFESVDERGAVSGINVDLLNRMSRNLGFEFEVVVKENWTAVLEAMQAGEVDLLGSLAATPERATYMDFIGPYMRVGEVFYVRSDSPAQQPEDLIGQRIGVIPSYAAAQWLAEAHPEYTTVAVNNTSDGLHKLSVGEIDAFFENIPVAADIIRRDGLSNIRIVGKPLYFSEANWGVTKDEAILYGIIEKGMQSIPPGEQTSVFEFWSGYDLGVQQTAPSFSTLSRNLLLAALGIIAGVALWSVSLRQTVRNRTRDLAASRQEVIDLNEDLEQRVQQRTHELASANQALEAFGYSVSHDLKTPLTAVTSYNQLLEHQYGEALGTEGQAIIERSDNAIDRMRHMIEDMLALSRAGSTDLARRAVDASALAKDVVASLQDAEPRRHVDVHVQPNVTIHADPTLLASIMGNLLGNAWKYTQASKHARIEFGQADVDGEPAYFVRDNGVGFEDDVAKTMFEPFWRAGSAASYEGSGIGLATVRRAVQRLGGRVWATSKPGEETTFWFRMGDA